MLKKLFAAVCLTLALCTPSFAALSYTDGSNTGTYPVFTVQWGHTIPCFMGSVFVDVSVDVYASTPPYPGTICDLYTSLDNGGSYVGTGNSHAQGTGLTTWTGDWSYNPASPPNARIVVKGTVSGTGSTGVMIVDYPSSDTITLVDYVLATPPPNCGTVAYIYYNAQTSKNTTATAFVLEFWDTLFCPNKWWQSGSSRSISPETVTQGWYGLSVGPGENLLCRFRLVDACGATVGTPTTFTIKNN